MRTDDSVSILTHAPAVSQSAPDCRKPLRRFLCFTGGTGPLKRGSPPREPPEGYDGLLLTRWVHWTGRVVVPEKQVFDGSGWLHDSSVRNRSVSTGVRLNR